MKTLLSVLLLSAIPPVSMASGEHAGSHGMDMHESMHGDGHTLSEMHHAADADGQAAPIGRPGDPAKVDRTVEIVADDGMRYVPDEIRVKAGETIRFFIRNTGKMTHELVLGTPEELAEHAEMMRRMPDMRHAEPNMAQLGPGQRGGLVWQFDTPGTVTFACLMPGHMEAGMVGKVHVE